MENALRSEGFVLIEGIWDDTSLTCLHGVDYTIIVGDVRLIDEKVKENQLSVRYRQVDCHQVFLSKSDITKFPARIEYGAMIREGVEIKENAVVLMGAVVNKDAVIGKRTMVDMNAVIGSGAIIGNDVHIGAGAVIAGVMEPASTTPVIIEDGVFIGANAVIVEGVHIQERALIGAGSVVLHDVEREAVMIKAPAMKLRSRHEIDDIRLGINHTLRKVKSSE